MLFADRRDAGQRLAAALDHLRVQQESSGDVVVVGLPRGGVPVAREVADAIGAPLDVVVVRKLGAPANPEYAMGAIGEDGVRVLDERAVRASGVSDAALRGIEDREREELFRRSAQFRGDRAIEPVAGRTVVVVDDGVATGSSARAACLTLRARGASRVVLAVPVAPVDWVRSVGPVADEYVALETPAHFFAVGQWYTRFTQTTDREVIDCLDR